MGAEVLHAVNLQRVTLEEALDERRLKLKVNSEGYVISVSNTGEGVGWTPC
jgi:hypothetical protein